MTENEKVFLEVSVSEEASPSQNNDEEDTNPKTTRLQVLEYVGLHGQEQQQTCCRGRDGDSINYFDVDDDYDDNVAEEGGEVTTTDQTGTPNPRLVVAQGGANTAPGAIARYPDGRRLPLATVGSSSRLVYQRSMDDDTRTTTIADERPLDAEVVIDDEEDVLFETELQRRMDERIIRASTTIVLPQLSTEEVENGDTIGPDGSMSIDREFHLFYV